MLKFIQHNYKILAKALKNGEPLSYILKNIFNKMLGLAQPYKAKRKLSDDYGYNIYLNKLHDKWEAQQKSKSETSKTKLVIIIIKKGDETAFKGSLNSLKPSTNRISIETFAEAQTKTIKQEVAKKYDDNNWYIILREGDEIFPWTIASIQSYLTKTNNEKAVLFDHDSISNGLHAKPHLKPYFNKRYLLEYDLIQNAVCIQHKSLLDLKENTRDIFESLYSWLTKQELRSFYHLQKPILSQGSNYQLNYVDLLKQSDLKYKSIESKEGLRNIEFDIKKQEKVSIIIPFRDGPALLDTCVNSILDLTNYDNYEIILADNNSTNPETLLLINNYCSKHQHIRALKIETAFNFSHINNEAVKICQGEILLFLNNDTEVLDEEWLDIMVSELQQENVGAVGPKLLYEDRTIQHAGVVPGIGHVAGHVFRGFDRNEKVDMYRLQATQEVAAVTGACLMTKKHLFEKVGGFDEINLKVAYNDVDYCFKLLHLNKKIIFTPQVELIHYESKSRKYDLSKGEKERYDKEVAFMNRTYDDILEATEFYHPAFSKFLEDYSINNQFEK